MRGIEPSIPTLKQSKKMNVIVICEVIITTWLTQHSKERSNQMEDLRTEPENIIHHYLFQRQTANNRGRCQNKYHSDNHMCCVFHSQNLDILLQYVRFS